jgi:hypothetical protein
MDQQPVDAVPVSDHVAWCGVPREAGEKKPGLDQPGKSNREIAPRLRRGGADAEIMAIINAVVSIAVQNCTAKKWIEEQEAGE